MDGFTILFVVPAGSLSGCGQFEEWTNDSPEITTLTLPKEVPYGETVIFKVRVFDAEDDDLSYAWEVSEGFLIGEVGPEVEWKAPDLPFQEIAPPRTVKVQVFVNDGGEERCVRVQRLLSSIQKLTPWQMNSAVCTNSFGLR